MQIPPIEKLRNPPEQSKRAGTPGIWSGTIQPCFGSGTEYSGGTGQYGTQSSSLQYNYTNTVTVTKIGHILT